MKTPFGSELPLDILGGTEIGNIAFNVLFKEIIHLSELPICSNEVRSMSTHNQSAVADPGGGGGSGVSTEPPFLAGYVINLICTVKDPGFMEPPFLPFSELHYNKTYVVSVLERILVEWQPSGTTEDLEEPR